MKEEIEKCVEILKTGGIILYPTDTVWGLGCDATNEIAVQKIYDLKQRSDSKSLIILVGNDAMLNNHVKDVPELAWDIIDVSEKPTTIVYPNAKNLANNVIGNDGSIAIRLIKNEFCTQLLYKFRKPIVSTSANLSAAPTPLSLSEINTSIINNVDFVVDARFDTGNKKPSSLIKLGLKGEIEILRK